MVSPIRCQFLTEFQALRDSVQIRPCIGKYIYPTRYRQIIETESNHILTAEERQWITEDQKHSSRVAKVHYRKRRSRDVALRGNNCLKGSGAKQVKEQMPF